MRWISDLVAGELGDAVKSFLQVGIGGNGIGHLAVVIQLAMQAVVSSSSCCTGSSQNTPSSSAAVMGWRVPGFSSGTGKRKTPLSQNTFRALGQER